ncbi:MAG TPA: cyclic nucleotide-binding domain-containing protein [Hyphomicrobiaceae bacterium]|nr:cyclic nucleotide-binding domain-containing protein [Hyphomicrobiaceae bacterium]
MALNVEATTLQQIPMFSGIDVGKLKLLAFAGQRIACNHGEIIFRQGEAADAVYIVLEGEVDIFRERSDGRVRVARLGRGQLIGEIGVLCDTTRTATVEAATELQVLRIEKAVFLDFVHELPQLAMSIIRELGRRLDLMNEQLARAGAPPN